MVRFFSLLYAVLFLGLGICSWIPSLHSDGELFGVFRIDLLQAIIYLLMGLIALWVSFLRREIPVRYFQVIGVFLALWAILGFAFGRTPIFGIIANNPPTTWLHVITGVVALIIGFGSSNQERR